MRNLKKHLEKIYRKSAFKLVQQGAKLVAVEPAAQEAAADASSSDNSSSSEAASQADSVSSSINEEASSKDSSTSSSSSRADSDSTADSSSSSSSSGSSVCEVVYEGDPIVIGDSDLKEYVGLPPFAQDKFYDTTPTGVVMGLAWTAMGGATLYVEAAPIIEVRWRL